jgi:hypothetical protein
LWQWGRWRRPASPRVIPPRRALRARVASRRKCWRPRTALGSAQLAGRRIRASTPPLRDDLSGLMGDANATAVPSRHPTWTARKSNRNPNGMTGGEEETGGASLRRPQDRSNDLGSPAPRLGTRPTARRPSHTKTRYGLERKAALRHDVGSDSRNRCGSMQTKEVPLRKIVSYLSNPEEDGASGVPCSPCNRLRWEGLWEAVLFKYNGRSSYGSEVSTESSSYEPQ